MRRIVRSRVVSLSSSHVWKRCLRGHKIAVLLREGRARVTEDHCAHAHVRNGANGLGEDGEILLNATRHLKQ